MRKPTRRVAVLGLAVATIILVACVLVGGSPLESLLLGLFFAARVLDDACRTGGVWAQWVLGGLSLVVIVEIALWIRLRPRHWGWMATIVGITATATALVAVPAVTCLGPSTKWWDPMPQLPCWGQVCLGRTSYDEVMNVLRSRPDVNLDSIQHYEIGEHRIIRWSFAKDDEGWGSSYFFLDGPLIAIKLNMHGITLGDVVRKFGEPDLFLARGGGFEGGWRSVRLLYRRQGILIVGLDYGHWKPQNGRENIGVCMPASSILYFDPGAPKKQLAVQFLLGNDLLDDFVKYQMWQGFGSVPYVSGD